MLPIEKICIEFWRGNILENVLLEDREKLGKYIKLNLTERGFDDSK
jgi:hypothetical protein